MGPRLATGCLTHEEPPPPRTHRRFPPFRAIVDPIEFYGNRAVVQCIVKVGNREFHNLRLFVLREGQWKLLGWANEEAPQHRA